MSENYITISELSARLSAMKLYSPKTVAKICDVDRSTAYRWMTSGVLPAFELVPGQWRCYEQALQRFIRKRARETKGQEDNDPTAEKSDASWAV